MAKAAAARLLRIDPLQGYAVVLVAGAVALTFGLVEQGFGLDAPLWAVALLATLAVLGERQSVRVSSNVELTVVSLPLLFAAVVYGPVTAILVATVGTLADFRAPHLRWAIWTAIRTLSVGSAGFAAQLFVDGHLTLGLLLAASLAAVSAEAVVDASLGAFTVAIRRSGSFLGTVRTVGFTLLVTIPLYAPVVALFSYLYIEVTPWTLPLFVAPAFATHRFYALYRQQRDATDSLAAANERLTRASISFATALVATLDARDRYTAGHSAAVAVYARDIAARMGLSEDQQQQAHLSGLVHDIGKIGLPVGLLEKNGPLTLEERRKMEEHSGIGERILKNVEDYAEIATIVRHHHERVDGEGYPDRLTGEEIPLMSRIIGVADAYDAMTSDRPYREAMPSRVARLRLAQAVESQFDTSVVAAFEAILAGATEEYRSGRRADFTLQEQERVSAAH